MSAGGFTTSSIAGNFFFGSDEPGSGFVSVESGVITFTSPNISGTSDQSGLNGTSTGSISGTYTISNSNGRGVITGGGGNTLIIWVIKGKRLVIMDTAQQGSPPTSQNVTIFNVEQ